MAVIPVDNKEYWEKRQLKKYLSGEKQIIDYYKELRRSFEQSKQEIQSVINDFYWRYAEDNQVTYAAAQLRLSKTELGTLQSFIDKVNKSMGKYDLEVNNLSIKSRLTRYEALQIEIDAILQNLYAVEYEYKGIDKLKDVYSESYYRTWFNIDQYNGYHLNFAQINAKAVEELIKYPFDGADFSTRLWKQKDFMLQQLNESITTMLVQGRNPKTLAPDFAKKFKTREHEAYRLLHTEASYIIEQASQDMYEEDKVERYQWIATLDRKTCELCQALDNKIFKVGEGIPGKTLTPRHPLCRCTTIPYYDEPDEEDTRVARNSKGKTYKVPASTSYEQWRKKYL